MSLLIFPLTQRDSDSTRLLLAPPWRARAPAQLSLSLAGCWVDRVVRTSKQKWTKAYRPKCSMHKYGYIIFPGHSCLRLEMGRYQFFCKIDTISKKVNLVSVYSWQRRQVGLYNKRVPHGDYGRRFVFTAMHYSANRGIEIARLSVWTLLDQEHIGWKSWKLIARTISPTPSLFVAQKQTKDG